ncbi:MAG: glycosyltransferase family 9 protein [Bacteroidota bacterium]
MKIAVIEPLGLGDVVLSLSVVQTLRKAIPDAQITMVVQKSLIEIPANHPDVDSVIPIHNKQPMPIRFLRLVSEFSSISFDIALLCPGSLTVAVAAAAARIPRRIGSDQTHGMDLFANQIRYPRLQYQTNGAFLVGMFDRLVRHVNKRSIASLYFTDVVPFDTAKHAAERFCSLLHPLRIYEHPVSPKISPSNESILHVEGLGKEFGIRWEGRPVALVPGSRWPTKQWGENHYGLLTVELIKQYPEKDIILCGHTADKELCARIAGLTGASCVKNLSGILSLDQLAEVFRRCSVMVGNDSGAGHCAAAVGTPVVTLFGPTIPQFGFFPLAPKSIVLEGEPLECRPCGPYGGTYCPVKTHECMTTISVESVVKAIKKIEG